MNELPRSLVKGSLTECLETVVLDGKQLDFGGDTVDGIISTAGGCASEGACTHIPTCEYMMPHGVLRLTIPDDRKAHELKVKY